MGADSVGERGQDGVMAVAVWGTRPVGRTYNSLQGSTIHFFHEFKSMGFASLQQAEEKKRLRSRRRVALD